MLRIVVTVAALTTIVGCESLFPKCDDPLRPCPDVEPEYPPMPRFGADLERACGDACRHLRSLGCPEGSGSMGGEPCSVTCQRAGSVRPLPLACWADAGTSAEAKACGSLRCVR